MASPTHILNGFHPFLEKDDENCHYKPSRCHPSCLNVDLCTIKLTDSHCIAVLEQSFAVSVCHALEDFI